MPIIQLTLNTEPEQGKKMAILNEITRLSAEYLKKPPEDIMILWDYREIFMNSSFEPAAFIDFRFITGFTTKRGSALCKGIADILKRKAAIGAERIYIHFIEAEKSLSWRFINGEPRCPSGEHI